MRVRLKNRERDIIDLLSKDKSVAQIAEELSIRPGTVNHYKRELMRLADVHSAAGLVGKAYREGWIE